MSKPQLAGEPSMDEILASIRRMITDDRPAVELEPQQPDALQALGRTNGNGLPDPGSRGAPHTPASPADLTPSPVAPAAQLPAGERTPATFNSLADALKVAAAHSERRLSANQRPEPGTPELQGGASGSGDGQPLPTASAFTPANPVSGQTAITPATDAWLGGASDTDRQPPSQMPPVAPHVPEISETWRTPTSAAANTGAPPTLSSTLNAAPKASERPDLTAFDFGTIVATRDTGAPGTAPLRAMPSVPPAAPPRSPTAHEETAFTALNASIASVPEAAATGSGEVAEQPPASPTPVAVAPISAVGLDGERQGKTADVAPVLSAKPFGVAPSAPLADAASPVAPVSVKSAADLEAAEPPSAKMQATESSSPERIDGSNPHPLPRPSFNPSLSGVGDGALRSSSELAQPLPTGVGAQATKDRKAVAASSAEAPSGTDVPPSGVEALSTTAGRASESVTQSIVRAVPGGLSNGSVDGGASGVVAQFPRLLPREVTPFQPPLTSKSGGWPDRQAAAGEPAVGKSRDGVETPVAPLTQPSTTPGPAASSVQNLAADVAAPIKDAAQVKADALLDAVVDLVQQQPGALSVLTSGASFIGGVDGPKPGLPALSDPHGSSESPAPQKLDRAAAELLRPMLRQWLAENMPRILEEALRSELNEQLGAARSTSDNK